MNNKAVFSYEDLNKSKDLELEIFGLKFGINVDKDYLERLRNIERDLGNETNDEKIIEECVNKVLGNNAYIDIKTKYKSDLNKDIDEFVWLKVFYFIGQKIQEYFNNFESKYENNNMNRYQRRHINRSNNYRGRNYRRY